MALRDTWQWEKISGAPIVVDDVRLTPQARLLSIRFRNGAFVWNRPVSVIVERGATRETRVVPDITLWSNLLLAFTLILVPLVFLWGRKGGK